MSQTNTRLIHPSQIPQSLWEADQGILVLPPTLASAYCEIIYRCSLRELSGSRNCDNPPVGGLTQERANEHFAQAFDGSVARAQLALLDPLGKVPDVADAFAKILAGNRVCIIDAPCGAGAAAFALLCNIAELRARGVLPRHPLDIQLIGAELSEPSRMYAQQLFSSIAPFLETQAIFVAHSLQKWNVTDRMSNTDLIRKMTLASPDGAARLLIVANFNAFLEKERRRQAAAAQLEELFRHASGSHSVAIWIEPAMNRAVGSGGLFSWIRGLVSGAWRFFSSEPAPVANNDGFPVSHAHFREPLEPTRTARVGLAVMRLDLERMR